MFKLSKKNQQELWPDGLVYLCVAGRTIKCISKPDEYRNKIGSER